MQGTVMPFPFLYLVVTQLGHGERSELKPWMQRNEKQLSYLQFCSIIFYITVYYII